MSIAQDFSVIVQSTTTHYRIKIYNVLNNALLYDSTKITLSTILYATEELIMEIPITASLAGNSSLKYTVEVWNGANSAISREIPFFNLSSPTLDLVVPPIVDSQFFEFQATLTQSQGVEASRFKYTLLDENEEELDNSGWVYNSSLRHTFSNFLDDTIYNVKCECYDAFESYATTGNVSFIVDYQEPSMTFKPSVREIKSISAIELKWANAYSLEGDAIGTYSFLDNYVEFENNALSLDSDSKISWANVKTNKDFVYSFLFQPPSSSFSGVITRLTNTETLEFLEIGYDGQRFYKSQNGVEKVNADFAISENEIYLIYLTKTELQTKILIID
jgi:hypothetical protein